MRRSQRIVSAVLLLVAACGPAATSTALARPDPNAELRIAAGEDQWPIQGEGAKSTTFSYPINVNVYEPLIILGSDYTLRPGLAESWELIQPNTWRFHIRKGVKYHNGHVLTADDVLWTWGVRQMEGKTLSTVVNTLGPDSVKQIDDYTIDITPKTPNLRLPEQILHPEGAILQRGQQQDSQPPNGTGPFKVVEYLKSDHVTVERFDDYWGEKAKVKRITFRFLPDAQTRIQALKAGEVDLVMDVPPDATRSLSSSGYKIVRSKPGRAQLIYVYRNGAAPHDITKDPAVRQAIAVAIDRKAYVTTSFDDNAEPGRAMAPDAVLGKYASQIPAPVFDQAKARQLLDGAGWIAGGDGIRAKAGRKLSLELIATPDTSSTSLELLQSQLKAVGIDIVIKKAADTATRNGYYTQNQFDLDLEPPNQNDANPAFLPVLRMYSKNSGTERFAPGGAFDDLALKSLSATTVDAAQEAAAQMMKILIADDFTVIPLAGLYRVYAMRTGVDLGDPHPSQTSQLWVSLTATK